MNRSGIFAIVAVGLMLQLPLHADPPAASPSPIESSPSATPNPIPTSPSATPSPIPNATAKPNASPTPLKPEQILKQNNQNLDGCASNIEDIRDAIQRYKDDNGSALPLNLKALSPKYLKKVPKCPAADQDTYTASYHVVSKNQYVLCCRGDNHTAVGATDYPRMDYKLGLEIKPGTMYKHPDGSIVSIPYVDDVLDSALSWAAQAQPSWGARTVSPQTERYRAEARKRLKEARRFQLSPDQKQMLQTIEQDVGKGP